MLPSSVVGEMGEQNNLARQLSLDGQTNYYFLFVIIKNDGSRQFKICLYMNIILG
jgi:hypothetical protein